MHRRLHVRRPLADRLWEKVDRSGGPEACWPYTAIKHNNYGTIRFFQPDGTVKNIGTHRATFLVTYGILSDEYMVLHKPICGGNKRCCNPAHLYLGTASDNAYDALKSGSWHPGRQTLTDDEVRTIREMYGQSSQTELAAQFDVTLTTISDILLGKVRQEAGGPPKKIPKGLKTHCHKGHRLIEGNIVYTHGTKHLRQCRTCYMETNRQKARRRLATNRDVINTQRRARRASSLKRLTPEKVAEIRRLHTEEHVSYRDIAARCSTSYSTVGRIIQGTYTARYAHLAH